MAVAASNLFPRQGARGRDQTSAGLHTRERSPSRASMFNAPRGHVQFSTEVSGVICAAATWLCLPQSERTESNAGRPRQGPQTFSLWADLLQQFAGVWGDPESIINYVYYLSFASPPTLISRPTFSTSHPPNLKTSRELRYSPGRKDNGKGGTA